MWQRAKILRGYRGRKFCWVRVERPRTMRARGFRADNVAAKKQLDTECVLTDIREGQRYILFDSDALELLPEFKERL